MFSRGMEQGAWGIGYRGFFVAVRVVFSVATVISQSEKMVFSVEFSREFSAKGDLFARKGHLLGRKAYL
jgi:hypothetical protein